MKATLDRKAFDAALRTVTPALPRLGGAMSALSGVRLILEPGQCEATCSDLDLTITTTVDADVDQPGTVVAPAALLARIVAKLSGDTVHLSVEDGRLEVAGGDARADTHTIPADEYPSVDATLEGDRLVIDPATLDGIRQVIHAVSTDQQRPIICGVYFANDAIVATDSYRLAEYTLPEPRDGQPVNVPGRVFKSILDHDHVGAILGATAAAFTAGRTTWTTRLIEGSYPNYKGLLRATSPHRIVVDRDDLAAAVTRVQSIGSGDGEAGAVTLTLDGGKLLARRSLNDVGGMVDAIAAEGDYDGSVAFPPGQVLELLDAHGPGAVSFGLVDAAKPAMVTTGPLTLLIMPVCR